MIYLASSSPRRRRLLTQAHLEFKSLRPSYREVHETAGSPSALARRHALGKAMSVVPRLRDGLVLGADTLVLCRGRILGKPASRSDAERMLGSLQGRWHAVVTAVALVRVRGGKAVRKHVFTDRSLVKIKKLSLDEIRRYFRRVHPLDKAGAYAAQDPAGGIVMSIRGSFSNVVGLPMEKLKKQLSMLR